MENHAHYFSIKVTRRKFHLKTRQLRCNKTFRMAEPCLKKLLSICSKKTFMNAIFFCLFPTLVSRVFQRIFHGINEYKCLPCKHVRIVSYLSEYAKIAISSVCVLSTENAKVCWWCNELIVWMNKKNTQSFCVRANTF